MLLGVPNHILKTNAAWVAYWLFAMGFISLVLKPIGYDYNKDYILFSFVYLLFSFFAIVLFNSTTIILNIVKNRKFQLQILISTIFFCLLALSTEQLYPITKDDLKAIYKIGILFPLFNLETYISKLCDIIFQQSMICILILKFKDEKISNKKIVKFFTITFLILHLPLFYIFKYFALVFILPSLIAGTIFSYLILYKTLGIFYSIFVHQLFYFILGILLRVNL